MNEILEYLKKSNFWEKNQEIPTGLTRTTYLERIKPFINNGLIKVIMGQRRVGKSYLLRQIMKELIAQGVNPKNIFYLNKEIVDFEMVKTHTDLAKLVELYKKTEQVKGKVFLFIDEVQEIDQWERAINSFSQDYRDAYEVYISGSNSTMLSSELSTYLSGRYVPFEVQSFSFDEFTQFFDVPKTKEQFVRYLELGGLPELYHLQKDTEIQTHYIHALVNTILFQDVVQKYAVKNAVLLEQLFQFIAGNIGSLFSTEKIVRYLNSNHTPTNNETLGKYLTYLEQTYLIHAVDRFDIRGKAVFTNTKKYYLNDLALRSQGLQQADSNIGHILENAIFLHYKAQGYTVRVGELRNKEVDFVLEKGKERIYVQVAYILDSTETIEREFGNLEAIRDQYKKIVISLDDISLGNRNGIEHIRAWEL
ncbi:MAG: ATP-binding protein [Candidatus Kerfeldbacteria bacterium]|nr:ATP-binding protein [Candidatus Kerfeldbacteria bacterium]